MAGNLQYDIILLTDHRYVAPKNLTAYTNNILLEDQLVTKALEKLGLRVSRKSWDDPHFDWSTTKAVVFRTPWDYFDQFKRFNTWFNKVATKTKLFNSKSLVAWNMDKHYFLDLMAQGIRMPKTFFIEIGENISLKRASEKAKTTLQFGEGDLILKPCISGGARDTYMIKSAAIDAHEAVFKELIKTKSMMLQEFQTNILTHGEVSLMVFDGQFTHAVLKVAKPGDYRVQDDHGGSVHAYQPKAEEIAFAEAVVRACPALPLYARVDLFKDNENQWSLVEVEIFEPELFFRLNPDAANVFAKTIEQKLNT